MDSGRDTPTSKPRLLSATTLMVSIALVVIAMLLDVQREFDDALETLAEEQVALATALGADFEARLARYEDLGALDRDVATLHKTIPALLGGALELEQERLRILLIARPDHAGLLTTDARTVRSPALEQAFATRASGAVVPREEALALGLPERIAVAGLSHAESMEGDWGVMVVVSGERIRARERYAQLRFLLGLSLVSLLVAGFGLYSLREQRKKLDVARALEVSALERERERLLAKADKMATLAALSSGIAHEVATPLGTIMARVEQVLPAVEAHPKASASLGVVLSQVERIQGIIHGVLGLARGELPPLVRTRPTTIVRSAVELTQHRFDKAGVKLAQTLSRALPEIACDPPMLEQALTNLLLNALDASPQGGTVSLTASVDHERLALIVEDDGEGINEEVATRAREAFFTTKPRGRGNGLGLAIVQEVVSHHRGKLTLVKREHGRGTRAVMELPIAV